MPVTRYVRFTSASQDLFVKLNVYTPNLYEFDPIKAICAAAQRYAEGKAENPHLNIVEFIKIVPDTICKAFGFTVEDVIDTHHFQPVASAITDLNAFASGQETRLPHFEPKTKEISDQDIKTYSVLVKATCDVVVPVISKTEEAAFKKAEDIVYKMLDDTKVENIDTAAIITLKTHKHIY